MNTQTLRQYLDDPDAAAEWLRGLGVVDLRRAHADLVRIAEAGVTLDLLANICCCRSVASPVYSFTR